MCYTVLLTQRQAFGEARRHQGGEAEVQTGVVYEVEWNFGSQIKSDNDECTTHEVILPDLRMNLKITVFVKLPFGLWMALWAGRFSPVSGPMGLI